MSNLNKENKAEIKRMAAGYYKRIRGWKKELSSALSAYKKAAIPVKGAVEKYERAMKKYNMRPVEKNRLICHCAKEKLVDAALKHNDAAKIVNSLVERIDAKYDKIADLSLKLDGRESVKAVNRKMSFLRKTTSEINEAEQIVAGINLPGIDEQTREIISWKRSKEELAPRYDKSWDAHDIQDAINEEKVELGFRARSCEALARKLSKSAEAYNKAKSLYDARSNSRRELALSMAKDDYLKAEKEYNEAATDMNRCIDSVFDGYDCLKTTLSAKRKRAALRIATEEDRYKESLKAKLEKINKPIKKTKIPKISDPSRE